MGKFLRFARLRGYSPVAQKQKPLTRPSQIMVKACNANLPKRASSIYLLAKRAFISLLLSLARADQFIVNVNRDSSGTQVQKACRRVLLKAHPDNGGQRRTPNGCKSELFATPPKSPTLLRKCFGFSPDLRSKSKSPLKQNGERGVVSSTGKNRAE